MSLLDRARQYLQWLIARPVTELTRAQRFLRFAVDLVRHCSRELEQDRAGQMAAALTYRTIFGIVPLLMVSMLAFRLFGDMEAAFRQLQAAAYGLLDFGVESGRPEAAALKAELDERLRQLTLEVASLRFEGIGAVGAVLFIWAALGLLVSLEQSANTIYRAPQGRGWLLRIVIYWTVLTLGPLLVFTGLWLARQSFASVEAVPLIGPLLLSLRGWGVLAATWLFLLLLYKLMPNTHVRRQPALMGSFVAALLLQLSKWGFGLYVSQALPYLKLYGAIGLVPLFLFWVYLNWLFTLFGLELAFTLQAMKGRDFERLEPRHGYLQASNPHWLIPMMAAIARAFGEGRPVGRQDLADELRLPLSAVAELADKLEEAGLVHQIRRRGTEDLELTLARAPDAIPIGALLELAGRLITGPDTERRGPGWEFLGLLQRAAQAAGGERTLAALVTGGLEGGASRAAGPKPAAAGGRR
jgi:membrane protein